MRYEAMRWEWKMQSKNWIGGGAAEIVCRSFDRNGKWFPVVVAWDMNDVPDMRCRSNLVVRVDRMVHSLLLNKRNCSRNLLISRSTSNMQTQYLPTDSHITYLLKGCISNLLANHATSRCLLIVMGCCWCDREPRGGLHFSGGDLVQWFSQQAGTAHIDRVEWSLISLVLSVHRHTTIRLHQNRTEPNLSLSRKMETKTALRQQYRRLKKLSTSSSMAITEKRVSV